MDDASARSLLSTMQVRLSRDPHEALGLSGGATAPEIRSAFLMLTKQFHPAKFARMASDIQKLANEVFLALRAAHDNLNRSSVTPRQSGPIATLRPTLPRASSSPQPWATGTTQPMRPVNAPPDPRSRLAQPSPPPSTARTSPSGATPTVGRTQAPATGSAPTLLAAGPDRELSAVLQLFELGQLAAARIALETLTTRSPSVTQYRALLHYAKGREAQLAKQIDIARVELQDALQIDPNLQLAKTALAELFTRRK